LPCLIVSNKLLLVHENTIATQLILEFQKFRACTFTFWLVMLSTKQ
jgi:hypothetical protein